MAKKVITIVGGGQSGLQLGNGLLSAGYDVRLVQDRKGDDIRNGKVMSSQCMFDKALSYERELGLNFWDKECPTVDSINFTVPAPDGSGNKAIDWNGMLDKPAQAVDQRMKFPRWMQEFEKRGGTIEYKAALPADLEKYAAQSDLVIVAAGKGDIARLFERDAQKSQFDAPQRALALTYVKGLTPRPHHSAVAFNLIPGRRRIFRVPRADHDRTVRDHGVRRRAGRPDGLLGRRFDPRPASRQIEMDSRHLPAVGRRARQELSSSPTPTASSSDVLRRPCASRSRDCRPAKPCSAWPTWSCSTIRSPGKDPTTPRSARRSISTAILAQGDKPLDQAWMQATFDRFWDYVQYVTGWTNALLQPPPPHVLNIMGAAQGFPVLARRIANGFNEPLDYFPWFAVPEEADKYLKSLAA